MSQWSVTAHYPPWQYYFTLCHSDLWLLTIPLDNPILLYVTVICDCSLSPLTILFYSMSRWSMTAHHPPWLSYFTLCHSDLWLLTIPLDYPILLYVTVISDCSLSPLTILFYSMSQWSVTAHYPPWLSYFTLCHSDLWLLMIPLDYPIFPSGNFSPKENNDKKRTKL